MGTYICNVCGYIYDEAKEEKKWEELGEDWTCPLCGSGKIYFLVQKEKTKDILQEKKRTKVETESIEQKTESSNLNYPKEFYRTSDAVENYMDMIHNMAVHGKTVIEPMRSKVQTLSWEDLLFRGVQLSPFVLPEDVQIKSTTIIGKRAKRPLVIESPVFVTHMSYGALSKEVKCALAEGSALAKTAMCSGEGGILEESRKRSYKYIFEYVPNLYSVTDENLQRVDAIEIKIGQGTKPGLGGHLPGSKVTEEIARVRQKPVQREIISPSNFENIDSKESLKDLVDELRERSKGRPIGIKIAAGRIQKDLDVVSYAGPDFITIDGRAGGTGASPKVVKDATTLPTIFALYRAKEYLVEHELNIDLIITGGLRISSHFAKALALGADAVAIGTAVMMAAACQQYRICESGKCPVGVATQDPELRARLHVEHSAQRVANFLNASLDEIKVFARICGHTDVHDLCLEDICTINSEISNYTKIEHV